MTDSQDPSDLPQVQHSKREPYLNGIKPDWALVRKMAITGTGLNGICKAIAKSKQQLDSWAIHDFKISISHLLDMWKETGHSMLREAQFESAVIDRNPLMLKFLGVNVLGQDKEQTVEVQLPRILLPPRRIDGIDDALPPPAFEEMEAEELTPIEPPDLTLLSQFESEQGDARKAYEDMAKTARKARSRNRRNRKGDSEDSDGEE